MRAKISGLPGGPLQFLGQFTLDVGLGNETLAGPSSRRRIAPERFKQCFSVVNTEALQHELRMRGFVLAVTSSAAA